MTANHEHTPSTEYVRSAYIDHRRNMAFYQDEYPPPITVRYAEFDRWYEAEIAAAEQRGSARALREAAIEISDRDGSTARGIIWSDRDSIVSWLRNRADQEGDDEK
ncbi:MAG: hypothetical protein HLX51_11810 [Micrococcaceae bacterium]|nr:hypothetical protein [Micrococcaceae bacterium]